MWHYWNALFKKIVWIGSLNVFTLLIRYFENPEIWGVVLLNSIILFASQLLLCVLSQYLDKKWYVTLATFAFSTACSAFVILSQIGLPDFKSLQECPELL